MLITIDERKQKSLETEFSIAISSDWRQMSIENTVSSDFIPRSSIVKSVFDSRLSGMMMPFHDAMTPETECTEQDN